MQEKLIHKLNIRAEKKLTLKKVKLNDINFNKTIDYLTNQKFLGFKEIYEILHARNKNEDFPIGNIVEDKEGRIVGFMGTFYSQKKIRFFFNFI